MKNEKIFQVEKQKRKRVDDDNFDVPVQTRSGKRKRKGSLTRKRSTSKGEEEKNCQMKQANESLLQILKIDSKKSKKDIEKEKAAEYKAYISKYEKNLHFYLKREYNEETMNFLKRMTKTTALPYELQKNNKAILNTLVNICQTLQMNKLEIALWAMWLDQNGWIPRELDLETNILMTGFAVKQYFNDIQTYRIIEIYLKTKRNDFLKLLNQWHSTKKVMPPIPTELNKKYRKLSLHEVKKEEQEEERQSHKYLENNLVVSGIAEVKAKYELQMQMNLCPKNKFLPFKSIENEESQIVEEPTRSEFAEDSGDDHISELKMTALMLPQPSISLEAREDTEILPPKPISTRTRSQTSENEDIPIFSNLSNTSSFQQDLCVLQTLPNFPKSSQQKESTGLFDCSRSPSLNFLSPLFLPYSNKISHFQKH